MAAILVIEDDENIAQLLEFMLARDGHAVERLADGEAARQHILTQAPPALVLLDSMLPFRDGMALLGDLRGRPEWADTPVIMLTAKSLERDIVRALEAGASDYIVKPFQPQELLARVRRHLRSGA